MNRRTGIFLILSGFWFSLICFPVFAAAGALEISFPSTVNSGNVNLQKTDLPSDTDLESLQLLNELKSQDHQPEETAYIQDGRVSFDNLQNGVYYVWQSIPCDDYYEFTPFLVSINSSTEFTDATPKMEARNAKTGDKARSNTGTESGKNEQNKPDLHKNTSVSNSKNENLNNQTDNSNKEKPSSHRPNVHTAFETGSLFYLSAAAAFGLLLLSLIRSKAGRKD